MNPEALLFTKTHEWVHVETDATGAKTATVGVSAFALQSLADLVFLDLPEVGRRVRAGEPFGQIESVKAVSDLFAPVDGEIIAVNTPLTERLEDLADDPYDTGWMVKIRITDDSALGQLLDYAAYQRHCADEMQES